MKRLEIQSSEHCQGLSCLWLKNFWNSSHAGIGIGPDAPVDGIGP